MVRKLVVTLAVAFTAVSAAAATVNKRIIGGQEAEDGEFPFIVSISDSAEGGGFCGGSLLDSSTVLTAAHCAGNAYYVKAGTQNSRSGGIVAGLAFVKEHPDYKAGSSRRGSHFVNDIAILKLSTPIEKSEKIGYATLPADSSDPVVNSTAIVAGWGAQGYSGEATWLAEQLRKVAIPIHAREDCWKVFPDFAGRDTSVCAGGQGKSAFKSDSGGPLIDQKTGELIGVAAVAVESDSPPAVYTRVASYMSFINEHLGSTNSTQNPDSPNRTKAHEQSVQAARLLNQQIQDRCHSYSDPYECERLGNICNRRKYKKGSEAVLACLEKELDEYTKWLEEQRNKRKGTQGSS